MATRALGLSAQRPASLLARVRQLERELKPRDSWQHELSREQMTSWLSGCPEAPELMAELEPWMDDLGGIRGLLRHPEGREVLGEVSRSFLLWKPQGSSQPGEEQER